MNERILIVAVGLNPTPNLYSLIFHKPSQVIFLITPRTCEVARRLELSLSSLFSSSSLPRVHYVTFTRLSLSFPDLPCELNSSVSSLQEYPLSELKALFERFPSSSLDIRVDLTGGMKTMAVSLFLFFQRSKFRGSVRYFYIDGYRGLLIELLENGYLAPRCFLETQERFLKPLSPLLILEVHGLTPHKRKSKLRVHSQFLQLYAKEIRRGSSSPLFLQLNQKIGQTSSVKLQDPLPPSLFTLLHQVLPSSSSLPRLETYADFLVFLVAQQWIWVPRASSRFEVRLTKRNLHLLLNWFQGFWLEEYYFWYLRALFDAKFSEFSPVVERNIEVTGLSQREDRQTSFEVDLLVRIGTHMVLMSVTTSKNLLTVKKQKFMEAFVRSEQTAGSLTNIVVISLMDEKDVNILDEEVHAPLIHSNKRILILGLKDLPHLEFTVTERGTVNHVEILKGSPRLEQWLHNLLYRE